MTAHSKHATNLLKSMYWIAITQEYYIRNQQDIFSVGRQDFLDLWLLQGYKLYSCTLRPKWSDQNDPSHQNDRASKFYMLLDMVEGGWGAISFLAVTLALF